MKSILIFVSHFSQRRLSIQTEALLRRELAQLLLAARDTERVVTLRVDDSSRDFFLGWFICISANSGFIFDSDLLDELMLDSRLASRVSLPLRTQSFDTKRCVLALRSETNSIRYYEVDQDKLELLCSLMLASRAGRPFDLRSELLLLLTEEGWVWPAQDAIPPLPDLPIRHPVRRMTQNFGESGKNF